MLIVSSHHLHRMLYYSTPWSHLPIATLPVLAIPQSPRCSLHSSMSKHHMGIAHLSAAFLQQWDWKFYWWKPLCDNGIQRSLLLCNNGTGSSWNPLLNKAIKMFPLLCMSPGITSAYWWPKMSNDLIASVQQWSKMQQRPWVTSVQQRHMQRGMKHTCRMSGQSNVCAFPIFFCFTRSSYKQYLFSGNIIADISLNICGLIDIETTVHLNSCWGASILVSISVTTPATHSIVPTRWRLWINKVYIIFRKMTIPYYEIFWSQHKT